jgi:hypothetical protein
MSLVVNYIISLTNVSIIHYLIVFNHSLLDSTLSFQLKDFIYTIAIREEINTLTIMAPFHNILTLFL